MSKQRASQASHRTPPRTRANNLACVSPHQPTPACGVAQQQRLRPLRSTGTDERASTGTDERLKSTLADLDALLGIKEEEEQEEAKVGLLLSCYLLVTLL